MLLQVHVQWTPAKCLPSKSPQPMRQECRLELQIVSYLPQPMQASVDTHSMQAITATAGSHGTCLWVLQVMATEPLAAPQWCAGHQNRLAPRHGRSCLCRLHGSSLCSCRLHGSSLLQAPQLLGRHGGSCGPSHCMFRRLKAPLQAAATPAGPQLLGLPSGAGAAAAGPPPRDPRLSAHHPGQRRDRGGQEAQQQWLTWLAAQVCRADCNEESDLSQQYSCSLLGSCPLQASGWQGNNIWPDVCLSRGMSIQHSHNDWQWLSLLLEQGHPDTAAVAVNV